MKISKFEQFDEVAALKAAVNIAKGAMPGPDEKHRVAIACNQIDIRIEKMKYIQQLLRDEASLKTMVEQPISVFIWDGDKVSPEEQNVLAAKSCVNGYINEMISD